MQGLLSDTYIVMWNQRTSLLINSTPGKYIFLIWDYVGSMLVVMAKYDDQDGLQVLEEQ